jgi:hypothetical protein
MALSEASVSTTEGFDGSKITRIGSVEKRVFNS